MSQTAEAATTATAVPEARRRPRRSPLSMSIVRTVLPLMVAIVALTIYSNSRNPTFLTWNNWQNILSQVCVLGVLAAGQTFLIIGGQMDLSVGSFVSFIGVFAANRFEAGWSTPIVIVICLAMGALLGAFWGAIVANLRVPPFVLTLGGLSVFASAALVIAKNSPISIDDQLDSLGFGEWFGVRAPAVVLIVVMAVAGVVLHLTRFGRNVYALGSAPRATFLAGVPTKRLTVLLFTLNSTLAALGGLVMTARLAAGDPRSGVGMELQVVAVTVLGGAALAGGRGAMLGTFLGVVLFGVINSSLTFLQVPGAYQSMVTGGILIFAVVVTAAADLRAAQAGRPSLIGRLRMLRDAA